MRRARPSWPSCYRWCLKKAVSAGSITLCYCEESLVSPMEAVRSFGCSSAAARLATCKLSSSFWKSLFSEVSCT